MFFHEKLICYQKGRALLQRIAQECRCWPQGYGFLIDQLKRATASILLNLAEGNNRKFPKERRRFFNIAQASAAEVAAIIDVAAGFSIISSKSEMELKDELLQITKMISKL